MSGWLEADWPAPRAVRAGITLRTGGSSVAPWDSNNVGLHVGDDPAAVAANRAALGNALALPAEPLWLDQVHGCSVWLGGGVPPQPPRADAAVARAGEAVLAIQVADCLPVLLCSDDGSTLGAAHGGWRGLAGGVLESTIAAMGTDGSRLLAWLGPAIGPRDFEVGPEVRAAFLETDAAAATHFATAGDRYLCDLYGLARQRLERLRVTRIFGEAPGSEVSTFTDRSRFFSYRRDGQTGRMTALIWAESPSGSPPADALRENP